MLSHQKQFLEYPLQLSPLFFNLYRYYGIVSIIHYVTQLHHIAKLGCKILCFLKHENSITVLVIMSTFKQSNLTTKTWSNAICSKEFLYLHYQKIIRNIVFYIYPL